MCEKIKEKGICEEQDYRKIAALLEEGRSVRRVRRISDTEVMEDYFESSPALVILGGGHISLALAKLGKMLGYKVIVADDREEFANRERFLETDEVYCGAFAKLFADGLFPPNASYVIVTRGHLNDYECLRQVLMVSRTYVGMIGSRRKVAAAFEKLREEGFTEEEIQSVHAPIGLAIGAGTPEEIAVSIAAQLIQEKAGTRQTAMQTELAGWLLTKKEPLMMVTIIKKKGSAPRGTGSRMLMNSKGNFAGTIGGGAVEYHAQQRARELLDDGIDVEITQYSLSPGDAADLGMICGGTVTVIFERVE